jgi:hypothetical protein
MGEAIIAGGCGHGQKSDQLSGVTAGSKERDGIRYAGQTEFGPHGQAEDPLARMTPLLRADCPFSEGPELTGHVLLVEPRLACQLRFSARNHRGI